MSRSTQDTFSDDFDDSEEEDYQPKSKPGRPTTATRHRSPKKNEKVINIGSVGSSTKKKQSKRPVSAGATKRTKKPAVEYWNDSLRRTGVGLTTETTKNNGSISGLSKKQQKDMAYSSTPHYLRQLVGTEKTKKVPQQDTYARMAPGTPAYKSPEEYYDEIIELKKQIANLNLDNSQMKSKVRRLEEDNLKKEREIEQLLDPTKSEELRRTLADRKPDAGVVIHSLKQKILKLEHQLKDRESAYSRLQSDLKTTKIDEMKLQVDTFYKEIVRLNQLKTVNGPKRNERDEPVKENNHAKLKALQETIMRMNEKSFRLTAENKTLRQDLEKTMEDLATTKEKYKRHANDHDRRQRQERKGDKYDADTVSLLSEIESRHGDVEGKITLDGSLAQRLDQLDKQETELLEKIEKQRKTVKQLKEDRDHYRKKSEEKEKEIKMLKHEIEDLKADIENLERNRPTPRANPRSVPLSNAAPDLDKRGSRSARGTRSRSSSISSEKGSKHQREIEEEAKQKYYTEQVKQVKSFREKQAASKIQRGWRKHHSDKVKRQEEEEAKKRAIKEQKARVEKFRSDRAAKKIQGSWKKHHEQKLRRKEEELWRRECEERAESFRKNRAAGRIQRGWIDRQGRKREEEVNDVTEFLQSAFRGHLSRKSQLEAYRKRPPSRGYYDDDESVNESDLDSATELIQSSMRGHMTRKDRLRRRSTSRSPPASYRGNSSHRHRLDSAGEENDDDDDRYSARSRSSKRSQAQDSFGINRKPPASPRKPSYVTKNDEIEDDSEDDSDDDIVITSSKRR